MDQIIEAGVYVDKVWQAANLSYRHSMSNGLSGQLYIQARIARDEWVSQNIDEFKRTGDYTKLGYAIHAMSDEWAPTHNWKSWSGLKFSNGFGLFHLLGELNPLGKLSRSSQLSAGLVVTTFLKATEPSTSSSSNPDPVHPITPVPTPITPLPPQPLPIPTPQPEPLPPLPPSPLPQPPLPLPPLR